MLDVRQPHLSLAEDRLSDRCDVTALYYMT
jgi:hypothetical protein